MKISTILAAEDVVDLRAYLDKRNHETKKKEEGDKRAALHVEHRKLYDFAPRIKQDIGTKLQKLIGSRLSKFPGYDSDRESFNNLANAILAYKRDPGANWMVKDMIMTYGSRIAEIFLSAKIEAESFLKEVTEKHKHVHPLKLNSVVQGIINGCDYVLKSIDEISGMSIKNYEI